MSEEGGSSWSRRPCRHHLALLFVLLVPRTETGAEAAAREAHAVQPNKRHVTSRESAPEPRKTRSGGFFTCEMLSTMFGLRRSGASHTGRRVNLHRRRCTRGWAQEVEVTGEKRRWLPRHRTRGRERRRSRGTLRSHIIKEHEVRTRDTRDLAHDWDLGILSG